MLNEQTQPMTAEEFISNNYSYSKEPLAWRLFKGSVASLMNDYANYRLAFEKEQHQPTDPYYTDPATWLEWANWTAVDENGVMFRYELKPVIRFGLVGGFWLHEFGGRVERVGFLPINPDWRNSLRSREKVSRGK